MALRGQYDRHLQNIRLLNQKIQHDNNTYSTATPLLPEPTFEAWVGTSPGLAPLVGPGGGGGSLLDKARDAIRQGADPAAVKRRLEEQGVDSSGL
jgi:hypothetical protein